MMMDGQRLDVKHYGAQSCGQFGVPPYVDQSHVPYGLPEHQCEPPPGGLHGAQYPYVPIPHPYGPYDFTFEPAFIRKRNERERQRVKCVNEGYARLREHLPNELAEKRLSKVETLRAAIKYIKHLQRVVTDADSNNNSSSNDRKKNIADKSTRPLAKQSSGAPSKKSHLNLNKCGKDAMDRSCSVSDSGSCKENDSDDYE